MTYIWISAECRVLLVSATVSDAVNSTQTMMTSCSVCADQLSRRALTKRLCSADFGEYYT